MLDNSTINFFVCTTASYRITDLDAIEGFILQLTEICEFQNEVSKPYCDL